MEHVKKKRRKWLGIFGLAAIVYLALAYLIHFIPPPESSFIYPLTNEYGGNLTSEILGGFLFLFLAFYLDAMSDAKIDSIVDATKKSEAILSRREAILASERAMDRFTKFLERESYHNVRFPDLNAESGSDSIGLEYKIEPVRDPGSGVPLKKMTEMETFYIVKVVGPSFEDLLTEDELMPYEKSPIRDNEYYFCRFFDGSWHMSPEDVSTEWYKFYLSSKAGPAEWGDNANDLLKRFEHSLDSYNKLATLHLIDDGTPLEGQGGCTLYEIYQANEGDLYLRIHRSLLKRMYYTNPKDTIGDEGWFFHIENMRGYAYGQKLENIKAAILAKLKKLNVEPMKIPWHEIDDSTA